MGLGGGRDRRDIDLIEPRRVMEDFLELRLESGGLFRGKFEAREMGDVRDVEIFGFHGSAAGSEPEMSQKPDDQGGEGEGKDKKENATFAPFLAERAAAGGGPVAIVTFVLRGKGDVEAATAGAGPFEEFFALAPLLFLREAGRLLDHALELLHLVAQGIGAAGEILLLLVKRGG